MTNKRFKVRRVGGEYLTEPMDVRALDYEDVGVALAGLGLIAFGLARRSIPGAGLVMLGGVLAWSGLKGRKELRKQAVRTVRRIGQVLHGDREGPSFPGDEQSAGARQMPEDEVDEVSMESFPASDSP